MNKNIQCYRWKTPCGENVFKMCEKIRENGHPIQGKCDNMVLSIQLIITLMCDVIIIVSSSHIQHTY